MTDSGPWTIPEAVEQAATRFADATAYVEGMRGRSRSVTWGELARSVRETAAGLIALGLRRGDRLAICAENGIDWIVAYLATVRAGGSGVLVYYDLRPAEIVRQVEWTGCRFLAASATVLAKLEALPAGIERVIVLGEPAAQHGASLASVRDAATDSSRELLPRRSPAPDDLAAVIYTSGTTGGAKGVMLSHRNFMSNGRSVCEALSFTAADSALLVLPLHHAMPFLATVVLPALVGAHFIIENEIARMRDRLREHRPTIFFGVPALYELMYRNVLARAQSEGRLEQLQAWQQRSRRVKQLTGLNIGPLVFRQLHQALGGKLRFLASGGAALNPATARDFFSLGLPLLQGWGMSEASPVIAVQRFSRGRFLATRYYETHAGSVGPPLPGVEARLIDVPEKDIRVAVSGEGEVIVRGENVFRGYWQAQQETRAVMLDGWLRTGDLGRIDREGNIYLTGRSKYVIVLDSGEKVHPDELEEKLSQSELLQDVCVVGRRLRDRTHVTAIVYPGPEAARARDAATDAERLQRLVAAEVERLGRELAAYKRVSRIELTDTPLPKTPLLKVARGQLAEEYSFDLERWRLSAEGTHQVGHG